MSENGPSSVAGVVVGCRPEHLAAVSAQVSALPWAEVHHSDPRGRLVVTVEAVDAEEHVTRLRTLGDLPGVLTAGLAGYYAIGDP